MRGSLAGRVARRVYVGLLRLHPCDFRRRFGGEMLEIFDAAAESFGTAWLLGEIGASLLRQRMLRADEEAAPARLSLIAGSYPDLWPPHLKLAKLGLAFVLSLTSFFLFPLPDLMRHATPFEVRDVSGLGR